MSIRRGGVGLLTRTRRALKWAAPALALVVVCAWIMSGERLLMVNGPGGAWAAVSGGRLWVTLDSPPMPDGSRTPTGVHARHTPFDWWFDGACRRGDVWAAVPLWVVVAALAGLGAVCRRAEGGRGRCHACGYDRSGLSPEAACPECGAAEVRG